MFLSEAIPRIISGNRTTVGRLTGLEKGGNKADLSSIPRCADAEARRHREDEVAGGWAEVAGPGAGHVCGGDDWGDAAEFSLR